MNYVMKEAQYYLEAVVQRCSVKKVFLEISQNSQRTTCVRVSFSIKLQAWNFIRKETLAQVFSCEFCEISKNTFSYRTPLVDASGGSTFYHSVSYDYKELSLYTPV